MTVVLIAAGIMIVAAAVFLVSTGQSEKADQGASEPSQESVDRPAIPNLRLELELESQRLAAQGLDHQPKVRRKDNHLALIIFLLIAVMVIGGVFFVRNKLKKTVTSFTGGMEACAKEFGLEKISSEGQVDDYLRESNMSREELETRFAECLERKSGFRMTGGDFYLKFEDTP